MVADYARSLLNGLGEFFGIFRDMFEMLPMPVQALSFFALGGFLFLCILHMIFIRS